MSLCPKCLRPEKIKNTPPALYQKLVGMVRNDRENNTIRGFRLLVELSFGIWCSWVQSGCKTRRIWCTHSFRFAVISERTMARGRKKKFSDYIRTEVARIYRLLHNVGTPVSVSYTHLTGRSQPSRSKNKRSETNERNDPEDCYDPL